MQITKYMGKNYNKGNQSHSLIIVNEDKVCLECLQALKNLPFSTETQIYTD